MAQDLFGNEINDNVPKKPSVPTAIPDNAPVVFNIGYQGKKVENLIATLQEHRVEFLVDIRSVPYSQNAVYNQPLLRKVVEASGIKYIGNKELGGKDGCWTPAKRREECIKVVEAAKKGRRICLMCMESSINQCHRKELAAFFAENGCYNVNL